MDQWQWLLEGNREEEWMTTRYDEKPTLTDLFFSGTGRLLVFFSFLDLFIFFLPSGAEHHHHLHPRDVSKPDNREPS
jgi:hypothetical protein